MKIKEKELNWDEYAKNYNERINEELSLYNIQNWKEELNKRIGEGRKRVLDIGVGPGFLSVCIAMLGHDVVGIDQSFEMLKYAANNAKKYDKKIELIKANAEKLPFDKNSFDVIVARNITYALSFPEKAFEEWFRVVKKNGKIIIYDANWFNFLFNDKEKRKVDIFLKEYHKKYEGKKHPTYEIEVREYGDHIYSRPMSRHNRPQWDYTFWRKIRVAYIKIDKTIGEKLYGKEYAEENSPTPFFVIEIKK